MYKVVFLRHGESVWNKENRFTGWVDCDLSEKGVEEAKEAGRVLKEQGFGFDVAFTSWQKRATRTTEIVLHEMGLARISVEKDWRLNERHYGSLQGLNKSETAKKYGEEQVHIWRRSWKVRPPALTRQDQYWSGNDPMYKDLKKKDLPLTESLKDTAKRVLPYWKKSIAPAIKAGKKVLISGHGSGMRAMVKYFEKMSDKGVEDLNIPTGIPLVYEFDEKLKPIRHYYLVDEAKVQAAIQSVKDQGKI